MLDNFATGNRANLPGSTGEWSRSRESFGATSGSTRPMRGVADVFHQAALPSVPRSVQDPLPTSAVNVDGTLNVLLAARDEGVRRIIFASSSSVYGEELATSRAGRASRSNPNLVSPYAVSKLAAERYCISFSNDLRNRDDQSPPGTSTSSARARIPHSQYAAVVPPLSSPPSPPAEPVLHLRRR